MPDDTRSDTRSPLPWPKDPPPGWPPQLPWPPEFPVGALGQKKCIEFCMANGGDLATCAILCAILHGGIPPSPNGAGAAGGGTHPPPPPPPGGPGVQGVIQAIDDDIIDELKQVARHRQNAIDELQRAASNRAQGNDQAADALTRSADRENAKAHEIEIEIRGKERAKQKAQAFK